MYACHTCWAHAWVSQVFTAGVRTNGHVEGKNFINKLVGGPKCMAFELPLALLHQYVGPYALQISYREMGQSVYYCAKILQLPDEHCTWHMHNNFLNDASLISTAFLLHIIISQGLKVVHLLWTIHLGTHTTHTLALFDTGGYVCDCCMGSNLGIPCCHFFCTLLSVKELVFHVALIRRR
ncbi:hypothetical protein K439DRAFT_1644727 [Ramaria rubella]|nr:hypothetical protein K439DRAFT_1644727 [Ramaria rubella]